MKNLRMRGGVAAAIVAAAAMVLSAIAIAPANAADEDASSCYATNQKSFDDCFNKGYSKIEVEQPIKFNEGEGLIKLGAVSKENYGKPASYTLNRDVTITGKGEQAILHNVVFTVSPNTTLTLNGTVVLDDVNLSGEDVLNLKLLNLVGLPSFVGIQSAVNVNGGTLNLEDTARIASGIDGATTQQRAIDVTASGSTVNLRSSGTYDRPESVGLDVEINLGILGTLGKDLSAALNTLLGVLQFHRDSKYPTVWGRDAAVYSDPDITDATINISNGTYSNQKDKHTLTGGNYLNAAISSSATVNIIGSNNVEISNTKIGNRIDSEYNGNNTAGTLNLVNPNARLDPATETSTDVQKQMTDSFALELRGTAKANIVAGSINDTLDRTKLFNKTVDPKVIESEVGTSVNILNSQYTDGSNGTKYKATIANRGYYIAPTAQKDDGSFTAWVNADASSSDPATSGDYQFWTGKVEASDDALTQLSNLVAAEDTGAAKLTASTYETGRLTAAYADSTNQAIYGKKIISSGTNKSPFQGVNDKGSGTVTLYGAPWTGTYKPGSTAPQKDDKLFAGWYTGQSQWEAEDKIQGTDYSDAYATKVCASAQMNLQLANKRHHCWNNDATYYPNADTVGDANGTDSRIVVSKSYSGSLYPHFVPTDTIKVTAQTSAPTNGKAKYFNVRLLGGMDSYNFKGATFDLYRTASAEKSFGRLSTKNVYDYVSQTVATTDGTESTTKTVKRAFAANPYYQAHKSEFEVKDAQGAARYLTTGVVKNVPVGTTFYVEPSWITLDGTTVTGARYALTVNADGTVSTTK